jgi:hypothetical protein
LKLKDVLAISPELAEVYELYYGEPSRTVYSYSRRVLSLDPYLVELCPATRHGETAFERIPELAEFFEPARELVDHQAVRLMSKPDTSIPENFSSKHHPVVGGKYIVGGLLYTFQGTSRSRYLTPSLADYVAMYVMSDCVRYQQDLWGSIVQGKTTGALGPVDLFISISKRRYPNLILNSLFGEEFDYGSPGRLM